MKKVLIIFIAVIFLYFQFQGTCEGASYLNQKEQKTRFRYTKTHQLDAIETYYIDENECEELLSVERFKWHLEHGLLTERTLEDSQKNVLIRQTLSYDPEGKLSEETAWRSENGPFFTRHFYTSDGAGISLTGTVLARKADRFCSLEVPDENVSKDWCTLEVLDENVSRDWCTLEVLDENVSRDRYTWEVPSDETSCKDVFFDAVGYCPTPPEVGNYKGENSPEKVRITFINGILNLKKDLLRSVEKLCKLHGNTTIHYVFKPTEGFTWDVLRSSLIKLGHVTPQAQALAELWKSLIAEMGGVDGEGVIVHYAHSSGGSNTYLARFLLTPEEQKMIKVVTLGSPTVVPNEGFKSVLNYMSISDAILFLDPISHFETLYSDITHLIYVGENFGLSLEDHLLDGKSYSQVLESHGKEFINLYYSGFK